MKLKELLDVIEKNHINIVDHEYNLDDKGLFALDPTVSIIMDLSIFGILPKDTFQFQKWKNIVIEGDIAKVEDNYTYSINNGDYYILEIGKNKHLPDNIIELMKRMLDSLERHTVEMKESYRTVILPLPKEN